MPQEFYVTVATVVPVLLLALMVETATVMPVGALAIRVAHESQNEEELAETLAGLEARVKVTRDLEAMMEVQDIARTLEEARAIRKGVRDRLPAMTTRARWLVRTFFAQAAMAEAAALYATAADCSTAFLVVLCVVPLLLLALILWVTYEMRFE